MARENTALNLRPNADEPALRPVPMSVDAYRGPSPLEAEAQAAVPLSHYLWILRRHCWKMLLFVAVAVTSALIMSERITPVYESTSTVDIDRQMPTGVVGQEATRSATNDADQFLATQSRLIQSDAVLRPVVHQYKLMGARAGSDPVSGAALEAPMVLRDLKVTRPPNTYLLLISYRSINPHLAADVANAVAHSYLEHTYDIRFKSSASLSAFMEKQLEELRAKMERSGMALAQFEREMDLINPEQKTNILSARLLQLNTEFTNAQADRMRKETAHQSVQGGALEAAQVSTQGEALKRAGERADDAAARFAEVQLHYGANHPEYRKAAGVLADARNAVQAATANVVERVEVEYRDSVNREGMLNKAVNETKAEFDRLNARSFEYQSLKREAEADKNLYEELVRKIREAGINASFQSSSIRIADTARPAVKPVSPNIPLNLALAFFCASVVALGAAITSDILDKTIRDPDQAARVLQTEVIGSLPLVKGWRTRLIRATGDGKTLIPGVEDSSGFAESIRTLRNSILLSDVDRGIRSLLVTSASPSEGKSTTSAYLAIAHAQQGHKTLLIDGDLRRPSLHRRFDLSGSAGLSDVLGSNAEWRNLVTQPTGIANLDILVAGLPSRRASDLIGQRMVEILEDASREYDLVVLDAPPMLGFAEPLQMAAGVDAVIVVTRAGQTNRNAVSAVLNLLSRVRANVLGIVLNEVHHNMSDSYYYYGNYNKYYHGEAKS